MKLSTNYVPRELEIFSVRECISIANIDATLVSTKADYAAVNTWSYYALLNTWLLQVKSVSVRGSIVLQHAIRRDGLFSVVKTCNKLADGIIHGVSDGLFGDLHILLQEAHQYDETNQWLLQILRYPKRFSPAKADLITDEAIKDFIAIEKRNKVYSARFHQPYLTRWLKDIIAERILPDYHQLSELDMIRRGDFSNGVAADSSRPFLHKAVAASMDIEGFFGPLYPLSTVTSPHTKFYGGEEVLVSVVKAVPKTYKSARIIAEEAAGRQYYMKAVASELIRCIEHSDARSYLKLKDQTQNQIYAKVGSIDGSYATFDLSHASDTVLKSFVREVFPIGFINNIRNVVSNHWTVDGKKICRMHMFSTAGSALTFPVESIVFTAIAMLAEEIYTLFVGKLSKHSSVYGDDIIVPTEIAEILEALLLQLGFIPNMEKTFSSGYYRESCGVEYYKGMPMHTKYFPRKVLTCNGEENCMYLNDTSILALTQLQHRLFDCWEAQSFLTYFVRSLIPDMTSHYPGTDCDDLWELNPKFKESYYYNFRAAKRVENALIKRHAKWNKKPSYLHSEENIALAMLPYVRDYRQDLDPEEVTKGCCKDAIQYLKREIHYSLTPDKGSSQLKTRKGEGLDLNLHSPGANSSTLQKLADEYRYYRFLLKGPVFENPLYELLGVSSDNRDITPITAPCENAWTLVKEV